MLFLVAYGARRSRPMLHYAGGVFWPYALNLFGGFCGSDTCIPGVDRNIFSWFGKKIVLMSLTVGMGLRFASLSLLRPPSSLSRIHPGSLSLSACLTEQPPQPPSSLWCFSSTRSWASCERRRVLLFSPTRRCKPASLSSCFSHSTPAYNTDRTAAAAAAIGSDG